MKGKILTFIIGLLIGALLATGGYYFYEKNVKSDNSSQTNTTQNGFPGNGQMPQGGPGGMSQDGNMVTPPDKPDGDNSTTPPAMPQGENNGETTNSNTTETNSTNEA